MLIIFVIYRMTSRGWCFTYFLADDDKGQLKVDETKIKYLCCQQELTKDGKRHLQGYAEFLNAHRMGSAKLLLAACGMGGSVHLEPRKGTPQQAADYCKKSESAIHGTFQEWGKLAKGPGQRTDLEKVGDLVRGKSTMAEIAGAHTATFIRYGRGIERARQVLNKSPKWRKLTITVLVGKAGTGKTRYAMENAIGDIYTLASTSPEWWDGYDGEKSLLIDDYYGGIPYERFLRILDGYALNLPVKGGFTAAHYTQVFITSNKPWASWYPNQNDLTALRRRLDSCEDVTVSEWGGNTIPPTPDSHDLEWFFDQYNTTC